MDYIEIEDVSPQIEEIEDITFQHDTIEQQLSNMVQDINIKEGIQGLPLLDEEEFKHVTIPEFKYFQYLNNDENKLFNKYRYVVDYYNLTPKKKIEIERYLSKSSIDEYKLSIAEKKYKLENNIKELSKKDYEIIELNTNRIELTDEDKYKIFLSNIEKNLKIYYNKIYKIFLDRFRNIIPSIRPPLERFLAENNLYVIEYVIEKFEKISKNYMIEQYQHIFVNGKETIEYFSSLPYDKMKQYFYKLKFYFDRQERVKKMFEDFSVSESEYYIDYNEDINNTDNLKNLKDNIMKKKLESKSRIHDSLVENYFINYRTNKDNNYFYRSWLNIERRKKNFFIVKDIKELLMQMFLTPETLHEEILYAYKLVNYPYAYTNVKFNTSNAVFNHHFTGLSPEFIKQLFVKYFEDFNENNRESMIINNITENIDNYRSLRLKYIMTNDKNLLRKMKELEISSGYIPIEIDDTLMSSKKLANLLKYKFKFTDIEKNEFSYLTIRDLVSTHTRSGNPYSEEKKMRYSKYLAALTQHVNRVMEDFNNNETKLIAKEDLELAKLIKTLQQATDPNDPEYYDFSEGILQPKEKIVSIKELKLKKSRPINKDALSESEIWKKYYDDFAKKMTFMEETNIVDQKTGLTTYKTVQGIQVTDEKETGYVDLFAEKYALMSRKGFLSISGEIFYKTYMREQEIAELSQNEADKLEKMAYIDNTKITGETFPIPKAPLNFIFQSDYQKQLEKQISRNINISKYEHKITNIIDVFTSQFRKIYNYNLTDNDENNIKYFDKIYNYLEELYKYFYPKSSFKDYENQIFLDIFKNAMDLDEKIDNTDIDAVTIEKIRLYLKKLAVPLICKEDKYFAKSNIKTITSSEKSELEKKGKEDDNEDDNKKLKKEIDEDYNPLFDPEIFTKEQIIFNMLLVRRVPSIRLSNQFLQDEEEILIKIYKESKIVVSLERKNKILHIEDYTPEYQEIIDKRNKIREARFFKKEGMIDMSINYNFKDFIDKKIAEKEEKLDMITNNLANLQIEVRPIPLVFDNQFFLPYIKIYTDDDIKSLESLIDRSAKDRANEIEDFIKKDINPSLRNIIYRDNDITKNINEFIAKNKLINENIERHGCHLTSDFYVYIHNSKEYIKIYLPTLILDDETLDYNYKNGYDIETYLVNEYSKLIDKDYQSIPDHIIYSDKKILNYTSDTLKKFLKNNNVNSKDIDKFINENPIFTYENVEKFAIKHGINTSEINFTKNIDHQLTKDDAKNIVDNYIDLIKDWNTIITSYLSSAKNDNIFYLNLVLPIILSELFNKTKFDITNMKRLTIIEFCKLQFKNLNPIFILILASSIMKIQIQYYNKFIGSYFNPIKNIRTGEIISLPITIYQIFTSSSILKIKSDILEYLSFVNKINNKLLNNKFYIVKSIYFDIFDINSGFNNYITYINIDNEIKHEKLDTLFIKIFSGEPVDILRESAETIIRDYPDEINMILNKR